MNKIKVIKTFLIILIIVFVSLISTPGLGGIELSKTPAYQVCYQLILTAKGYDVWKLQTSEIMPFRAHFEFYDGCNTAICTAIGAGSFWYPTNVWLTIVGCYL